MKVKTTIKAGAPASQFCVMTYDEERGIWWGYCGERLGPQGVGA